MQAGFVPLAIRTTNGTQKAANANGHEILVAGLSVYAPAAATFSLRVGSATGTVLWVVSLAAGESTSSEPNLVARCGGDLVFHVEAGDCSGLIGSVWLV